MAEEADISLFIEHSGMIAVVYGERIDCAAVRCDSVALASFAYVTVDYVLAVDSHLYVIAVDTNFFCRPFSERLMDNPLGRNDAIDRTMDLIFAKVRINRSVMVEYLYLAHAVIGGVYSCRGTDTDSVVDARTEETEFKTEDEVFVLFLGVEIVLSTENGRNVNRATNRSVAVKISVPAGHVHSIEKEFESFGCLLWIEDSGDLWSSFGESLVDGVNSIKIISASALFQNCASLFERGFLLVVIDFFALRGNTADSIGCINPQSVVIQILRCEEEGPHRRDGLSLADNLFPEVGIVCKR